MRYYLLLLNIQRQLVKMTKAFTAAAEEHVKLNFDRDTDSASIIAVGVGMVGSISPSALLVVIT